MTAKTTQTLFAAFISLIFVLTVLRLGRKQKLSFRYTVGWLILGCLGLVAGALVPVADPIANKLHLSPAAFLGVGAVILLVTLCVQLSISISGMQKQLQQLNEDLALQKKAAEDSRAASK